MSMVRARRREAGRQGLTACEVGVLACEREENKCQQLKCLNVRTEALEANSPKTNQPQKRRTNFTQSACKHWNLESQIVGRTTRARRNST